MAETDTGGGGTAAVNIPLFAGGIYTLANHGAMHAAVHENIEPEVFAGFVGWMLWGLELTTLAIGIILAAALIVLLVFAFLKLAEKTA